MLTIYEKITINADVNKIWTFLTDFSLSLNYNRFHTKLELPAQYSIGKMKKFKIDHNFGFGNYDMVAEITDCIPPNKICLWEYCIDDKKKGFPHKVEFRIEPEGGNCTLYYRTSGTYGGKVQDMSFKPILKGVIIEELLKIKNAIESSEDVSKPLASETVKPDRSGKSEAHFLESIASRSNDPLLRYGTDEDTFGQSTRGMDPHSSAWDLTNDPMAYYKRRFEMSEELIKLIPEYFEKPGEKYSKIRRVFGRGLGGYLSAARNITKYIGGIHHSRHHVGDPGGNNPFTLIPAEKQREALNFILDNILAKDTFQFDPDLLNKLAPERDWDFKGSVWRMSRIDYPIHDYVRFIQSGSIYRLHHPRIFARIRDNELKFTKGESIYALTEHFQIISKSLWSELEKNNNVNSFRRDLQKSHVEVLTIILLNERGYFHSDAVALARASLRRLHTNIKESLELGNFDDYTYAHLSESANKIQSAYKAQTVVN